MGSLHKVHKINAQQGDLVCLSSCFIPELLDGFQRNFVLGSTLKVFR